MSASHEPGVKGVSRAKSPSMMRIIPRIFLKVLFTSISQSGIAAIYKADVIITGG